MLMTQRMVNALGYISLTLMLLLIILTLLNILPQYLQMPIFLLAVALFLLRTTLRLLMQRQRRIEEQSGLDKTDQPHT